MVYTRSICVGRLDDAAMVFHRSRCRCTHVRRTARRFPPTAKSYDVRLLQVLLTMMLTLLQVGHIHQWCHGYLHAYHVLVRSSSIISVLTNLLLASASQILKNCWAMIPQCLLCKSCTQQLSHKPVQLCSASFCSSFYCSRPSPQ